MPRMILFSFSYINKCSRKSIPVFYIITTTSPDKVSVEIFRAQGPTAPTARQLTLPTRSAYCMNDPCCWYRMSECCLSACWNEKDREKLKIFIKQSKFSFTSVSEDGMGFYLNCRRFSRLEQPMNVFRLTVSIYFITLRKKRACLYSD